MITEITKVVPGWSITITPNDFIENPEKYSQIKIVVVNDELTITRDAVLPILQPQKIPFHLNIIKLNVANLICKYIEKNDLQLFQEICDHFSKVYESRLN